MKIDVDARLTLRDRHRAFTLEASFASPHDRVVLFGPSGVGKTMTIQLIAGLQRPDRGHVKLGGRVLFDHTLGIDVPARDRRIGYVFQDYALFPHLSVARNIAFGLLPTLPWRLSEGHREQVSAIMKTLNIEGLQDRLPSALSGGQRQRVALARALIRQPEVLLLDEPFSALDTRLRAQVREELDAIQQRFGIPMVLISHDLDDVRLFGDTLVRYQPTAEGGQVIEVARSEGDGREVTLAAAARSLSGGQ